VQCFNGVAGRDQGHEFGMRIVLATKRNRLALLVIALTLGSSSVASATPIWMNGDEITYPQALWGGSPLINPGAALVVADFGSVYAETFGVLTLGLPTPGFSMTFDAESAVRAYLPAPGPPGPLTQSYVDPTTTSSGGFGGDVLALQLNVDFSDAGFLIGTSSIRFADLVLENFGPLSLLNGRTVRQILGADNSDIGGATTVFSVADLEALTAELNIAFGAGVPSTFAQNHLRAPSSAPASVPEPATLTLTTLGLAGIIGRCRRRRTR
jgi:hypothetical protein